MRLSGLRRIAVRQDRKIRFRLHNGMECEVDERGVALVPALRGVPDFSLERELESVESFTLLPGRSATGSAARVVTRAELEVMIQAAPCTPAQPGEHPDD